MTREIIRLNAAQVADLMRYYQDPNPGVVATFAHAVQVASTPIVPGTYHFAALHGVRDNPRNAVHAHPTDFGGAILEADCTEDQASALGEVARFILARAEGRRHAGHCRHAGGDGVDGLGGARLARGRSGVGRAAVGGHACGPRCARRGGEPPMIARIATCIRAWRNHAALNAGCAAWHGWKIIECVVFGAAPMHLTHPQAEVEEVAQGSAASWFLRGWRGT